MWVTSSAIMLSVVLLLAVQCTLGQSAPTVNSTVGLDLVSCKPCKLLKLLSNQGKETNGKLDALQAHNEELERKIDQLLERDQECSQDARDCADLYKCGKRRNGVYSIQPDDKVSFNVYCDMTTAGGGWTVFQKRLDGSVEFFSRGWSDYKSGFGDLYGEFWLGLDKINRLTNADQYSLRVDLQEENGKKAFADYDFFAVSSENTKYQLSLGTYSGDAGDSLGGHRGHPFSTKDRDNDSHSGSCAAMYGAWWYTACHSSNLNGKYLHGQHTSYANGINWKTWKGYHYSAVRAEMKMRPVDFS